MRLSGEQRRKVLINITPLIDVVFLLLIFFVVTSTFLEQPGIDLSLPEASSAEIAEREDVVVQLAADGQIYLQDAPVAPEALFEQIEERLQTSGTDRVILEADERVPHGRVVEAMDAARRAGATALVVATQPEGISPDNP